MSHDGCSGNRGIRSYHQLSVEGIVVKYAMYLLCVRSSASQGGGEALRSHRAQQMMYSEYHFNYKYS